MRWFSISTLFFISIAYLDKSSWSPALAASLQFRDVFSSLSMYMHDIGTKSSFLLHNQPWAALNAAPREAESVEQDYIFHDLNENFILNSMRIFMNRKSTKSNWVLIHNNSSLSIKISLFNKTNYRFALKTRPEITVTWPLDGVYITTKNGSHQA